MNKNKWDVWLEIEDTYNTDPTPTSLDRIYTSRPTIKPVHRTQERNRPRTGYGATPKLIIGETVQVEFDIELVPDWAAATDVAPSIGKALRACQLTQTINTGTSIVYANNSSPEGESITLWIQLDALLYKITGIRGNVSGAHVAGEKIVFKFSFEGIYKPSTFAADNAFPTFTPSINANPLIFQNAELGFTGWSGPIVKNFNWDMGNEISKRMSGNSNNGIKSVRVKNTIPKADVDPDMEALSVFNPFTATTAGTLIDLSAKFLNSTRQCLLAINDLQLVDSDPNGDDDDINKYALKFEAAQEADVSFTFTDIS